MGHYDKQAHDNFGRTMRERGSVFGPDSILYVDPAANEPWDSDDQIMVCDICEEALSRFTGYDGEAWVHTRSWVHRDHDPTPRAISRSEAAHQVCDFCGLELPIFWVYVGDNLRQGSGNTIQDYGTRWGACDACSTLIKDGDLERLLDRVMRVSPLAATRRSEDEPRIRRDMLNMWVAYLPTVHTQTYVGPKREPVKLNARMMPKLQMGLVRFWKQPGLRDQMTQGRIAAGQTHSLPGLHCGQPEEFIVRHGPDDPTRPEAWKNHTDHLAAGIMVSELIWVSANFTQLAIMAGQDFEKLLISREELPEKFGFMVFENSIGEIQRPSGPAAIRGVSWTLVPGGVWLNLYIQGEDADPDVDVEEMRAAMGYLLCPNPGSGIAFDQEIPAGTDGQFSYINTIFATWFLMNQPGVAERTSAPVDKKFARAFHRSHGRPLPDVRLVDLRRRPRRNNSDTTGREGKQLTVRIWRKEHWKLQAFGPGRSLRRQVYISSYIAGPDGAPLKERTRVVKVLR